MIITDIFRLSTRMFKTNRLRTILTILGISVGIGTILFLVSFGYGIQQVILSQITTSDSLLSLDVTTGDADALKLDEAAATNIKAIPEIEKISPLVTLQSQIHIGEVTSELSANFANSEFFKLEGIKLKRGEMYSDDGSDKNKVLISSAALQLFDLSEDDIFNQDIKLSVYLNDTKQAEGNSLVQDSVDFDNNFKVVGIIDDDNSNYLYLPVANVSGWDNISYSRIKVKVDSQDNLDIARNKIIDQGFIVSALSDIIQQANQIFGVVQIVLSLFGIVALIVSAIGMFNTMTIALLERIQEIGIMKALGATNMDIWNMFLGESVIIGFIGGLGGIIIGYLGGQIFNYGLNILAGALGGQKIDLFYTPFWFIVLIMVFSTVVGVLTGVYPASRAAKINCLEALRYK